LLFFLIFFAILLGMHLWFVLTLKIYMAGVFTLWVLKSRKECSSEKTVTILLFFLIFFAILLNMYLTASGTAMSLQAFLYPLFLFLTLPLECSFAALWGYRSAKELGCVALCSLVTHLTLRLIAFLSRELLGEALSGDHWIWYLEAVIFVVESFILDRLLSYRRADNAKLILAMNAFSFPISWGLLRMLG
jgi:hypothetical protein